MARDDGLPGWCRIIIQIGGGLIGFAVCLDQLLHDRAKKRDRERLTVVR